MYHTSTPGDESRTYVTYEPLRSVVVKLKRTLPEYFCESEVCVCERERALDFMAQVLVVVKSNVRLWD